MRSVVPFLRSALCFSLLAIPFTACVREYQEPQEKTYVWVTREKGKTTVRWEAKRGTRYMLMYRDPPSSNWITYPGAEMVIGTGAEVAFEDRSPKAYFRKYRAPALVEMPVAP